MGLGNPGPEYENQRHNVGFMLLDKLAAVKNARWKKPLLQIWQEAYWYGKDCTVWLLKPLTYMNRSGVAVGRFLRDRDIPPERTLVIADQIDLPPGRLRLRRQGSDGGHRGLRSIDQVIQGDYPRLWVGVGRPPEGVAVSDWVLSDLGPDAERVNQALDKAASVLSLLPDADFENFYEQINSHQSR